jgi:hypothetical protein
VARWLFPSDRLVFRYGTPGTPLYSPAAERVVICTDSAGTALAGIQAPDGTTIDATLSIGQDCLIPEFLGPDGLTTLYARNSAGIVSKLYAQSGQFFAGSAINLPNVTAPPATPTGGGVLFVQAGALKYKGSSGTTTTIAPA